KGLGGWGIDGVHLLDRPAGILHLGSGEQRRLDDQPWIIDTVAGRRWSIGDGAPFGPVGGLATAAKLSYPDRVIAAPDGGFYFTDSLPSLPGPAVFRVGLDGILTRVACGGTSLEEDVDATSANGCGGPTALGDDGTLYVTDNNRIRRVGKDGKIRTVWGKYPGTFLADGAHASAGPVAARSMTLAPDGSFFVAWNTSLTNSIRRIGPDGIVATIAGGAGSGLAAEGESVTTAALNAPLGLTVAPNGSLVFADEGNRRVREIRSDGRVYTIAGKTPYFSYPPDTGDGGPANDGWITDPRYVAVAADGTVFFSSGWVADGGSGGARLRIVRNGLLQTIAGGVQDASGDGGPAFGAGLRDPSSVAVLPDGSVIVAQPSEKTIRRVRRASAAGLVPDATGAAAFAFDGQGRPTKTIDTLTGTTQTSFSYDGLGNLTSITDADGDAVTIARDAKGLATTITGPFGHVTKLAYDADGNLAQVDMPDGASVKFTYSAGGLLIKAEDPLGRAHSFSYDSLGRLASDVAPDGASTALTRTDAPTGWTSQTTTATALTTTFQVDSIGPTAKRWTTILPNGVSAVAQVDEGGGSTLTLPFLTVRSTFAGDPRFGVLAPLPKATMSTGGITSALQVRRTVVAGASVTAPVSIDAAMDFDGGASAGGATVTAHYDAATGTVALTSPEGRKTSLVLGKAGRLERFARAGEPDVTITYDSHGRATSVAQGTRAYSFTFDGSGNLTAVKDPLDRTTSFTFDAVGKLLSRTLFDKRVVSYGYDLGGRLTSVSPPDRMTHGYVYDAAGVFAEYKPPAVAGGITSTTVVRDKERRPVQILRADGTAIGLTYNTTGELIKLSHPHGSITRSYDPATKFVRSIETTDQTTSFSYSGLLPTGETIVGISPATIVRAFDTRLRVASETIAGSSAVVFQYDRDGNLTRAGEIALTLDAPTGRPVSATTGDVVEAFEYDAFGVLSRHSISRLGNPLFSESFVRDALSRVTVRTEAVASETARTTKFTYDPSGALKSVDRDGLVTTFTYDANGNRIATVAASSTTTATYDGQDRLLTYGTRVYAYGKDGEVSKIVDGASGATTSLEHDALGNVRKVVMPSGKTIEYVIDGEHRRVARKVDGGITDRFVYLDGLRIGAEVDTFGSVLTRYVYATRGNVPDYLVRGGKVYRCVVDSIGSVRLVVEIATGTVVQRTDYDPFGLIVSDTIAPGFKHVPFGFAGGIHDRDTGLVRFGAREYDPVVGRWTSRDPALFRGGDANFYRYAHGDPVNAIDVDGKHPLLIAAGATLAALSVIYGMGAAAPSDTAGAPADILGMALSVTPLKSLPSFIPARPSPVIVVVNNDARAILERTTDHWVRELAENPELLKRLLKPGELRSVQCGRFVSANFGKALERAVAEDLEMTASNLFKHVGHTARRGKPIWDFEGLGQAAGRKFDVTTVKDLSSHMARPYGKEVEFVLYEAPYPWNLP
ncbi:MAG: hypothetical protein HYV09_34055, partial [Deltaproteobacteria bacterium]|nr:hypothetical protein [Deltaproteobacteria bacterium]